MSTNQSQKNQSQKSQTQDQSAQAPLLSQQTLGQLIPDFQDRQVTTALRKLIGFSLAIIGLPLSSMFIAKIWLFEGMKKVFGFSKVRKVDFYSLFSKN